MGGTKSLGMIHYPKQQKNLLDATNAVLDLGIRQIELNPSTFGVLQ
jgi:hypothetical protein